jgi:hypothetical protein
VHCIDYFLHGLGCGASTARPLTLSLRLSLASILVGLIAAFLVQVDVLLNGALWSKADKGEMRLSIMHHSLIRSQRTSRFSSRARSPAKRTASAFALSRSAFVFGTTVVSLAYVNCSDRTSDIAARVVSCSRITARRAR